LGGEVAGGQALAPGPGHSRQDRSLAVTIGQTGKIIVCSFAGAGHGVKLDPFATEEELDLVIGRPSILIAPLVIPPSVMRKVLPLRLIAPPSGLSAVRCTPCGLSVAMFRIRLTSAGKRSCPK